MSQQLQGAIVAIRRATRREDEEGSGRLRAQVPQHFELIRRTLERDHDQIRRTPLGGLQPLRSARRMDDPILMAQRHGSCRAPDLRRIPDHEDERLVAKTPLSWPGPQRTDCAPSPFEVPISSIGVTKTRLTPPGTAAAASVSASATSSRHQSSTIASSFSLSVRPTWYSSPR